MPLAANGPLTRMVVEEVAGDHWHLGTESAAVGASRCRFSRWSLAGLRPGSSGLALLGKSWSRRMKGRFEPAGPAFHTKAELAGRRWLGFGGLQKAVFVGQVSESVKA